LGWVGLSSVGWVELGWVGGKSLTHGGSGPCGGRQGGSLHPSLCPQVGNLKAHLKIHIADGPLKCRECGKQFTTSGSRGLVGGEGRAAEVWLAWGGTGGDPEPGSQRGRKKK